MIFKTSIIKERFFITLLIIIALSIFTFVYYSSVVNASNKDNQADKKDFIKWVDFSVCYDALDKTSKLDINSHLNNEDIKYNWIELLAYLSCKSGGNLKKFNQANLDTLVAKLKTGATIEDLTKDMKYYNYYYESYNAILSEFIGTFSIQTINENGINHFEDKYGIKTFLPIAKNYSFSHYDDFGNSRSYGFRRTHLGNDLMGNIGTPIVAVESGIVEALRLESIWWLENRY